MDKMIEKLFGLLGYVKIGSMASYGILPIDKAVFVETKSKPKYGDACKDCGSPAYNDRGKGLCYLCDTDNQE